jgi:hypothetical protein
MARAAIVLRILIASPSDVAEERQLLTEVIHEWNAVHSLRQKLILEPIKWETHSYPSMGKRPQQIVNEQIVRYADAVIGIFGVRLGTPTGQALSGTIEEIEELRGDGKHVALYFSDGPVSRHVDREQLDALERYRKERAADTLYATYSTLEEFRQAVARHLPQIVAAMTDRIRSLGELQQIKHELSTLDLREKVPERLARPQINANFVRNPEGFKLKLSASADITVKALEYIEEFEHLGSVRTTPDKVNLTGREFEIPIDLSKVNAILSAASNPRGLSPWLQTFRMKFRVDLSFGNQSLSHVIPVQINLGRDGTDYVVYEISKGTGVYWNY